MGEKGVEVKDVGGFEVAREDEVECVYMHNCSELWEDGTWMYTHNDPSSTYP